MVAPVAMNQPGKAVLELDPRRSGSPATVSAPPPLAPPAFPFTAVPFVVLALLLAASVARPAAAQVRAGGHAAYQNKVSDGTFGVGGRAEVDLGFIFDGLALAGSYDRFFPGCDDCTLWDAGGWVIASQGPLYLGLGTSLQRYEGADVVADTEEWGFHALVGLKFLDIPVIVPFVEYRQQVGAETLNRTTFSLGILLGPSRARAAPRRPGQP